MLEILTYMVWFYLAITIVVFVIQAVALNDAIGKFHKAKETGWRYTGDGGRGQMKVYAQYVKEGNRSLWFSPIWPIWIIYLGIVGLKERRALKLEALKYAEEVK